MKSVLGMRRSLAAAMLSMLVLGLSACVDVGIANETAPSRFYVLSAVEPASAPSPDGPSLLIGPVTMPRYLDRPQIVTRPSPNQLAFAEYDRWGGRLDDNFTRVLAQNLSVHLNTNRVAIFPREQRVPNATQITLDIARFEQVGERDVELDAQWSLHPPDRRQGPSIGSSRIRVTPKSDDFPAIVAAMSEAIDRLSQEIAAAARKMPRSAAS